MPEISKIMGIVAQMHSRDHCLPHIHIRAADTTCSIDFNGKDLEENYPFINYTDFSDLYKEDLKSSSGLKDEKYFKTFFIKDSDLQWANGWDVAPDCLFDISVPAKVEQYKPYKKSLKNNKKKAKTV